MIISPLSPVNATQGPWIVNGQLDVTGDVHVQGNIVIDDDSYTYGETYITDPITIVNYLSGGPVSGVVTQYAGLEVDRGLLANYQIVFDENDDSMRIGEVGDLQAISTREDVPISGAFGYWNDVEKRFDTDSYFTTDTVFTYADITVANLSGALDSHYVNKAGDTMTGSLTIGSGDLTVSSLNTGGQITRTDSNGKLEESGLSVINAPTGGSGIAVDEYATTPSLVAAPTGFIWVEAIDENTKKICFYNGSDTFSVELGKE